MKKLLLVALTAVLLLTSAACASSSRQESGTGSVPAYTTTTMTTATPTRAPSQDSSGSSGSTIDIAARLIVRNGDLTIMVDDIQTTVDKISALAEQKQGFVVSSSVSPAKDNVYGYITIRVPAADFESSMAAIAAMAIEVKTQNTSSRDVTQEYTDLNSRLTNLLATEQQYLEILKKAVTVTEILAVQQQLSYTRGEIEVTKGQIIYLEQTSSTSLISVNLQQSKLIVSINMSRTVANADETIAFSPNIAGGFSPFSYEWSFGDKVTSTKVSPEHSYKSSGDFTVTLKVTDDRGNTATDDRTIHILGGWDGGSIARGAWRALITTGRALLNVVIWLGIFSFIWIPIGALIYFLVRRNRKKRKQG